MRTWLPAVLACAALVSCARDATPQARPTPSTTSESASPTPTPAPTTAKPTVKPSPSSTVLKTDLADGKQYVYLKAMSTTQRTFTLDVVQFLTGEAARKAAQEDGQEADNDYYIRNQNTKLRTLTYAPTVTIVVNTLTAEETGSATKDTTITQAKLKSYFDKGEAQQRLFILTLQGGQVVKVNEQYLP